MTRLSPIRRLSLTAKMTALSLLTGLAIWLVLDQLVARAITETFQDHLDRHLQQESLTHRVQFSSYINSFGHAAELYANHRSLRDYLEGTHWQDTEPVRTRFHQQTPPWFVKTSTRRSFVAPRFAVLYDPWRNPREVFLSEETSLPETLLNPPPHLLHVSENESYLTPFSGIPHIVTSNFITGADGSMKAILLIGSPLDTDFLVDSQGGVMGGITVALISDEDNRVVVSSDPVEFPEGTALENPGEGHLSTGQEFFEYGSSDVNFKFASFITTSDMNRLSASFSAKVRNYRAAMAAIYILSLIFLTTRVTKRIEKLTARVDDYSIRNLGGDRLAWDRGDQIDHLDLRFQRLTEQVEKSHLRIKTEAEDRSRREDELKRFERQISLLSSVTEAVGVGIIIGEGTVVKAGNKKMEDLLDDVTDLSVFQLGDKIEVERSVIDRNGERRTFQLVKLKLPYKDTVVLVHDMTERRRTEAEREALRERLARTEKMESIGRLAGGIAHDFNNILSAILGFAELTALKMDKEDPLRPHIEQIISASTKAADLTGQLLTFSRKQIIKPEPVNLGAIVRDMRSMALRLIREDIQLETETDEQLWHIMADPLQINQILINLLVNSRDAMPVGGTITIKTKNFTVDGSAARIYPGVAPGEYVLLSVSDTGIGIPKQMLEHIYEPFFTTKDVGKGTGLGLATIYGIVKQNRGHISVYSEPGEGTTFEIIIPMSVEGKPPIETSANHSIPTGEETILVAEDEGQVRTLVLEVLDELGYQTFEARNGTEAANMLDRYCEGIDLLLTDVVMPGMSGRDLAEHAHDICPNICVLFMSGYTDDAILQYGVAKDQVQFLQKPVSPMKIAQAVRNTLDTDKSRRIALGAHKPLPSKKT